MERLSGLSHIFMTIFLYTFSGYMVVPAITDVTMSALCPGEDECSIAIYLAGIQQAIIGLGSLVMMPLIGNFSDTYGRKVMLTVPMTLTILPIAILAYNRTKAFFYAYYVLKILTSMVCEGSAQSLALAYVADNIPESRRVSAFGILSGVASCAFVCGNLSTRFLSTAAIFQVSTSVALIALLYMRVFLPESIVNGGGRVPLKDPETVCLLDNNSTKNKQLLKSLSSLNDSVSLLKSSLTLKQAAVVAFFVSVGDSGLYAGLLYYLKACFHFNKDQFADLMVINGVAGTISQLLIMPILAPVLGEEKMLSLGLFFCCAHIFLYGIAWSVWVPYVAAALNVLAVFALPCLRSIASKQVRPTEQGKAQGFIAGICSFANIVSPLAFSPLTALFLSESAPFHFPGFSLICAGLAIMIAFIQSAMMKSATATSHCKVICPNVGDA